MPNAPRQNYWLFATKKAWTEIQGVPVIASLCGAILTAIILWKTGFSDRHDTFETIGVAVGGGFAGLIIEFAIRLLRVIPKIYSEQLEKIQALEERKQDAESKQKLKEGLTNLLVNISSRRSEIQDMGGEKYHFGFMSKRDNVSNELVDEAEQFLRTHFDEAKARIFRDDSGFSRFSAQNSSYPIWLREVHRLEQYAIRLQKIIEELN